MFAYQKSGFALQAIEPYKMLIGKKREGKKPSPKGDNCKCKFKCMDISKTQKEYLISEFFKLTKHNRALPFLTKSMHKVSNYL